MYELIKKDGRAKRGRFHTVHGTIETPVFMNVGTAAAIKGAVSTDDLRGIKTQVELSNTYHLHVRPGDEVVKKMGGLHKFMNWDKPILTDSGGFQVFSLAGLRKIKEEGVHFNSHIDGRKIFMGPEESMQIQSNLASTIAMAFDECPSSVADRECIVVKQGMVVAVECLEGTDAALRRGGELRGEGCVAIKRFKPKQDERVDLPSIGLQTVRLLIEQHYRCLAVDAGKTLFFDRAEALALADKHNFCIVALTEDSFGKLRLQAKAD